jgi:hypothetical protein
MKKKGQAASGIGGQLITLLLIVAIAFVTIRIGNNMSTSISGSLSSTTSEAAIALGNFSSGFWDAQQLMSVAPYLIGALIVLSILVGFSKVAGGKL